MTTSRLFEALQKKLGTYARENLDDTIRYQDQDGNHIDKPLLEATLDEVAFAIQTLGAESSNIILRRNSLNSLYTLAREHGCVGSKTISEIAQEVTK